MPMRAGVELPPPPPRIDDRGSGGEWVELVRARDDIDASLLAGRLSAAAIESRSVKDATAPTWMYGGRNPWAPVVVLVRRYQLDDARLVLAEVALNSPARETPPPARTGATAATFSVVWWVGALLLGALISALIVVQVAHQSPLQCRVPLLC